MTTRDDTAGLLLIELARREAEIEARPRPPAWKTWEARPDDDDREYGPRYSPTWFGDLTTTDRFRVDRVDEKRRGAARTNPTDRRRRDRTG